MKKYKFLIKLSDDIEVDSAEEIEAHVSWPNYSQADPIRYRGIFDTYEEAEKYASNFTLYKYVTNDGYDSFDYDEEDPYFISIFDAEDAVCAMLDVEPGTPFYTNPDEYIVEEITEEDEENDISAGTYRYYFVYEGERIYDSLYDGGVCYDSHEEACEAAEGYIGEYEVPTDEYPCDWLFPIEAEGVEIVEFDDEEEQN
jgi:hypothetical protein